MVVRRLDVAGSLGSDALDAAATAAARRLLEHRQPAQVVVDTGDGPVSLYIEPHYPPDEMVIVGAGHIARPLCRFGVMLGFRVTVLDDRSGFTTQERFPDADRIVHADFSEPFRDVTLGAGTHLVLVTRGHRYDYDALCEVLRRGLELPYIGMVGSQRRVRAALEQLVAEGVDPDRLARIHAPIGLDIGAETPEEIALAIAAEIVRVRRGGTGISLRDQARVVDRWIRR
jgi:xanthine dehydrogenase accessory factor